MAEIATCPQCAKQLGLPASIGPLDRATCPECQATFLLSEAVQISLPVAQLAPATAPLPAEVMTSVETNADVDPGSDASELTPQQSWEERLKKALALDSSSEPLPGDPKPTKPKAVSNAPIEQPAELATPSFEFKLDPPQATEVEPAIETAPQPLRLELPEVIADSVPEVVRGTEQTPVKTLADFAAAAVESSDAPDEAAQRVVKTSAPALDKAMPRAEPFAFPKLNLETPSLPNVKPTKPKQQLTQSPIKAEAEVRSTGVSTRRAARAGFPKRAAFAVGPIAGTLVGLYGLLWVQGRPADYVGLSHVLPASILPASFSSTSNETEFAGLDTSIHELLADQSSKPASTIKRDTEVSLASATLPLTKAKISASEFVTLVDSAAGALPDLVSSDMTTPETTKRMGQAYMTMCGLAEHFDYGQQMGLAPQLQAKAATAKQILRQATADNSHRKDLAHVASRWWEYGERPNAGIFFGGQVVNIQAAATGMLCWVQLKTPVATPTIPVWIEDGSYRVGDSIGVVGQVLTAENGMPHGFAGKQIVRLSHGFAF